MKKLIAVLSVSALFITGCTTTETYAGRGAAVGALAGGVIGHQHRDRALKGALIGATVGGLAGTAMGQQQELKTVRTGTHAGQTVVYCPSCQNPVDVTGLPPNSTVLCPYDKETRFTY